LVSRAEAVTEHLPAFPGERQPAEPSISRMACIVPGLLIVIAIAVGGGLGYVRCLTASGPDSYTTRTNALPDGEPVFLSDPGIYLVRRGDDVIALDHHEPRPEDALRGCFVRYRETLEAVGRRGLFRSDCTGTLYGLDGMAVQGDGLPMKRHPVEREDGKVTVDFRSCFSPGEEDRPVPC